MLLRGATPLEPESGIRKFCREIYVAEEVLRKERQDGLLILTLNRPERRNALDVALSERLLSAVQGAASDSDVRCVLLRGEGGTFCVGGDVKAMAAGTGGELTVDQRVQALRRRSEVSRLLHEMPKPTVAVISGAAAGAGLSIAMACDFRISAQSAKLTVAFAKVGLSGDYGGTYLITKLLGGAKARDLYLNSPVMTAEDALQQGLLHRVVADDAIEQDGLRWGRELAAGPTVTFGYMKQAINLAEHASMAEVLDVESMNHIRCSATDDHREAAAAFVDKRAAVFGGR